MCIACGCRFWTPAFARKVVGISTVDISNLLTKYFILRALIWNLVIPCPMILTTSAFRPEGILVQ